jgi:hypothetical protein
MVAEVGFHSHTATRTGRAAAAITTSSVAAHDAGGKK